jgi:hypothetical protein
MVNHFSKINECYAIVEMIDLYKEHNGFIITNSVDNLCRHINICYNIVNGDNMNFDKYGNTIVKLMQEADKYVGLNDYLEEMASDEIKNQYNALREYYDKINSQVGV